MTTLRRTLPIALSAALLLTSCKALLVGAAAVTGVLYVKGDFTATIEAGPRQTITAAQKALNAWELQISTMSASDFDGQIVARTALGKRILIEVRRLTNTFSEVSIRIGVFGDENMSRTIYQEIRNGL